MIRASIPFWVFLILFIISFGFPGEFATSVIPGWHATIFSPLAGLALGVSICLLLVTIAYYFLHRGPKMISLIIFLVHLGLTLPVLFYLKFPFLLLVQFAGKEQALSIEHINTIMNYVYLIAGAFLAGQLIFITYFFKMIRHRKPA